MCGAFGYVGKIENIEKALGKVLKKPKLETVGEASYFIKIAQPAFVITDKEPNQLQEFIFGFAPSWSNKRMYLINARAEEILTKPSFRTPIRTSRCIIPATHFFEGTTNDGWKKPYCIHLNYRPFFFAGIYSTWIDPSNEQPINTFAIITTEANQVLQSIPHHRSPVILPQGYETEYLKQEAHLANITQYLQPTPNNKMDLYPINPIDVKTELNKKETLTPIGKSYWTLKQQQN